MTEKGAGMTEKGAGMTGEGGRNGGKDDGVFVEMAKTFFVGTTK